VLPSPSIHRPDSRLDPPAITVRGSRFTALKAVIVVAASLAAFLLVRSLSAGEELNLPKATQDMLTLSISVVIESLPFVFLGIVLSIVVQLWLPSGIIVRLLPANHLARRAVISLVGMLLPVCECGNVPLARGLVMRGFSPAESITFLLAAPILNPITIVTTFQAFGWNDGILVSRIIGGFLIANLLGWMFSRHPNPERILTGRFAEACRTPEPHGHNHGRLAQSVSMFAAETTSMMPALLIGAGIAGLVQVAVSREVLVAIGGNPLLSIAIMMLLAFVISICSNVDAFFALSLGDTFMPGSLVAFLVFGPMIDIKMIALMRTTYSMTTIIQISTVVALATVAIALMVNYAA